MAIATAGASSYSQLLTRNTRLQFARWYDDELERQGPMVPVALASLMVAPVAFDTVTAPVSWPSSWLPSRTTPVMVFANCRSG